MVQLYSTDYKSWFYGCPRYRVKKLGVQRPSAIQNYLEKEEETKDDSASFVPTKAQIRHHIKSEQNPFPSGTPMVLLFL